MQSLINAAVRQGFIPGRLLRGPTGKPFTPCRWRPPAERAPAPRARPAGQSCRRAGQAGGRCQLGAPSGWAAGLPATLLLACPCKQGSAGRSYASPHSNTQSLYCPSSPLQPVLDLPPRLPAAVHVGGVDLAKGGVAAAVAHHALGVGVGGGVGVGSGGQQADLARGQALQKGGWGNGRRQVKSNAHVLLGPSKGTLVHKGREMATSPARARSAMRQMGATPCLLPRHQRGLSARREQPTGHRPAHRDGAELNLLLHAVDHGVDAAGVDKLQVGLVGVELLGPAGEGGASGAQAAVRWGP